MALALVLLAASGALLTTPPVINLPSSVIHLPNPAVIHLPATIIARRRVGRGLLPAPPSASRPLLPMGSQPAGLLSWSGASTFRALVVQLFAVVRYGVSRSTRFRAKRLGWEPPAGLLSWRGASTFRALV